jgi:hypothetical protein
MSLETWMDTRKLILLNEKKDHLFAQLPRAPHFRALRAELYHTLTRIERQKRAYGETNPANAWNIPIVA